MQAPAFPAVEAPFVFGGLAVRPDWTDYNGHMNVAYYVRAFDLALEAAHDRLGLHADTLLAAGVSLFTLEMHVTYLREVKEGDPLRVTTQLLGFDAKRAHYIQCMYQARDEYLAATNEWLLVFVDMTRRKAAAMPESLRALMAHLREAHSGLPVPPEAGRRIDLANRRSR